MSRLARIGAALSVALICSLGVTACHNGDAGSAVDTTKDDLVKFDEAIAGGDKMTIEHMLEAKPKLVNMKDDSGKTPLEFAGAKGDQDVIKMLRDKGATD